MMGHHHVVLGVGVDDGEGDVDSLLEYSDRVVILIVQDFEDKQRRTVHFQSEWNSCEEETSPRECQLSGERREAVNFL